MRNIFKKIKGTIASRFPIITLGTLGLMVIIFISINSVETTNTEEQLKTMEDNIMRSAIHCYSLEGAYPEDISYLEEYYSLTIDWDKYIVHYEIFATNIAPDITVILRTNTGGAS